MAHSNPARVPALAVKVEVASSLDLASQQTPC